MYFNCGHPSCSDARRIGLFRPCGHFVFCILDKEEEELESNLKKQYEANLEYKLTGGARRHKGLGFQDEEKSKEEVVVQEVKERDSSKNDQEKPDQSGDNIGKESSEKHEDDSEDKNSTQESKTPDSTKKYSLSFVKASS